MVLGLSKGIRLSRDSLWERSLSPSGAGEQRQSATRGSSHPWRRATRREATKDFIPVFPHPRPQPCASKPAANAGSQGSYPEYAQLSTSPLPPPYLSHHRLFPQALQGLPIFCSHGRPSGLFWTQHPWRSFHRITLFLTIPQRPIPSQGKSQSQSQSPARPSKDL